MNEKLLVVPEGAYWAKIQELAQNAVVQVFAQVVQFNWLEPYNIESQFESLGSAFFIHSDGYLITNAHVVNEATRVWVHVPSLGQQPLHADIIGFSPDRDLALLKLKPEVIAELKEKFGEIGYFSLGDSDKIMRTESVLSLGYPLGQHRLKSTTGVVSGLEVIEGRSLIQITAPVNPGNSGGPLLNVQGEVIGIAIASIIDAQNVGYAIPVNELRLVLEDLYTDKLVRKPVLGVCFTFANDEKARYLKNPIPGGLYVSSVVRGSLFDKAGVQEGDMLYEFNGYQVDAFGEVRVTWTSDCVPLFDLIGRLQFGHKVEMTIYRAGVKKEVSFIVEPVVPLAVRTMYPNYEKVEYEVVGGLVIMQLTENHVQALMQTAPDLVRYRWPENRENPVLIISHILPGSYAHQMRVLVAGDLITHVNDNRVQTLEEFRVALRKSSATGLLAIKTEHNTLAVFSLDRVLAEEERLSSNFMYPISKTVHEINLVVKTALKK